MRGDVEPVFIDTSVLVYATVQGAPWHDEAKARLAQLRAAGTPLWISRQILREYAAVVTRPQSFAQALSPQAAAAALQVFANQFHVADETAVVTIELVRLLQSVQVGGKQIHDANIVATMLAYQVSHLLTHNTVDFARFAAHVAVLPLVPVS